MALYSVWDWNRNAYRVYATQTPVSVGVDPTPPEVTNAHPLGAIPYVHCKVLPTGAKFIGISHVARGEIARDRKGVAELLGISDGQQESKTLKAAVLVGIGVLGGLVIAKVMR